MLMRFGDVPVNTPFRFKFDGKKSNWVQVKPDMVDSRCRPVEGSLIVQTNRGIVQVHYWDNDYEEVYVDDTHGKNDAVLSCSSGEAKSA